MMMNLKSKLALSFLLATSTLQAAVLEVEDVVSSSLKHYPDVINSFLDVEGNQAKQRSLEGTAFDAKIKGNTDSRFDGYYDGKSYKVQAEKPLPYLNSRVYGGYRRSNGLFPDYEGKADTLSDGETFLGFSLSLLRDSLIDLRRYNIALAREDVNQASFSAEQMKIDVQTMALKAYWTWVIKGHVVQVRKSLLELSEKRAKQLEKRIKAGDLAQIYGVENLQYIRKREVALKKQLIEYQRASFYLSLFFRDQKGESRDISRFSFPDLDKLKTQTVVNTDKIIKQAADRSPQLKIIKSQEVQAKATTDIGTNSLLPKVDLSFEVNEDRGAGSKTLKGREERMLLSLEIPLEFNKGQGKRIQGRIKQRQLLNKKNLMMQKMKVKIEALVYKINSTIDIVDLSRNQIELADKLSKAEVKKFRRGASDLILVNLREENLAEAQVKNLESLLKYYYYQADLKQLTLDYI